jgi:LPXTG-motif cell wall-anchored protein
LTQNGHNNSFQFTIEVNPLGEDLVKNKESLVLIDELEEPLVLEIDTIKVYEGDKDSTLELSSSEWSYSLEKKSNLQYLKMNIPDQKILTIKYSTTVNSAPSKATNISNKVYWEGYSTNGSSYTGAVIYHAIGGTASGLSHAFLALNKRDSSGGVLLGGASYQLQSGKIVNNEFQPDEKETLVLKTSEKEVSYSSELEWDTVYQLTEVVAPSGYVLDSSPHYFLIAKNIGTSENPKFATYNYPSWIVISYTSTYSYTAYNSRPKIQFTKKFLDKTGKTCSPIPGTYRFGLYNVPKPSSTSKPIQMIEVTYRAGEPNPFDSISFENLEEGSYSIFEIDDNGQPIVGTSISATVGGNCFFVSSTGNLNLIVKNKDVTGAEIVNRLNQFSLPDTGGGRNYYSILGAWLVLSTAFVYFIKNKKMEVKK